jgi:hypothetical protein
MSQQLEFKERTRTKNNGNQKELRSKLFIVPVSLDIANEFVERFHTHNSPVPGSKVNLGVIDEQGLLHGVAIVGRPVARLLDDGWTLEVNRVATDRFPNSCSALYGAARRVAREMGYRRLITYTLQSESGASLRGAGWKRVSSSEAQTGKGWQSRQERKKQDIDQLPKYRWEALLSPPSITSVVYPWEWSVDRCRLVFARKKSKRLDITKSVLEAMLYITDGKLPFHFDDAVFALEFEIQAAQKKGLLSDNVPITAQQVQHALDTIVAQNGLENTGAGWYSWINGE